MQQTTQAACSRVAEPRARSRDHLVVVCVRCSDDGLPFFACKLQHNVPPDVHGFRRNISFSSDSRIDRKQGGCRSGAQRGRKNGHLVSNPPGEQPAGGLSAVTSAIGT